MFKLTNKLKNRLIFQPDKMDISYINLLNEFQLGIFEECLLKTNAGISVPMGGGKSRLVSVLAMETTPGKPNLIICKKTLIKNWIDELRKIFDGAVDFYVYHSEYSKDFISIRHPKATFTITTPDVTKRLYKDLGLEQELITRRVVNEGLFGQHEVLDYTRVPIVMEDAGLIYSTAWGTVIVDEFQEMSNIETDACRSLLAIPSERRWALSGTLFSEPKPQRILAYYMFVQDPDFPNNLPGCRDFIKSKEYKGYNQSIVLRTETPYKVTPIEHRIIVPFNQYEEKIYLMIREMVIEIAAAAKERQAAGDELARRRFSAALLGMLTALTQCLVSPITPVASIAIDICNLKARSEISSVFMNKLAALDIMEYLDNEENILSSRIKVALDIAERHKKVVMFSVYRTTILLIKEVIVHRRVLTIDGSMSVKQREAIFDECNGLDDFIFIMTYDIGSCGLNLQVADTVILLDYDWNLADSTQAIARVARYGQEQEVNVYYMLSNTGVEDAILKKQLDKVKVSNELADGPMISKIEKFKTDEIVTLLQQDEVNLKFDKLYITKK